eukprot:NODE_9189_length_379_cov_24.712121_g8289_i0.p3 GENE.NODE_9189_length_379_cov_24.712121_g8289_i0~~NODE_9189_length_379_cov_24.712121_g8289_i0.p3  ORF type:complete len:55 (+),score=11.74 NODE_9189_length_379_cov_24.712121_g8289_i0:129-293(+)
MLQTGMAVHESLRVPVECFSALQQHGRNFLGAHGISGSDAPPEQNIKSCATLLR